MKQVFIFLALMLIGTTSVSAQTEVKNVQFARGKNSATLTGTLRNKDSIYSYKLRANAGQKMQIQLTAPDGKIWYSLDRGTNGNSELLFPEARGTETIELPANDSYNIGVFARNGMRNGRYTLKITIL